MRIYYGWIVVAALGVTETISWGILFYAFAVYLTPMQAELGWSRGDMTGAFSLGLLLAGLAAMPVGRWLDRHGPRLLMTVGSCAGAALVLAWSRVATLPQLYLVWAGIGLAMSATLYDPAFATATRWFERQRLRALTVITLMAGFASTIFLPLAESLVRQQGWRASLVTLAIILAVGTIPAHALLLRRRPEDLGLRPDGDRAQPTVAQARDASGTRLGQALREPSFWWLVASFWLTGVATVAMGVHLVPYLQDRGYDPAFAATATGLVGAMQVVARLVLAPFGDRSSPRTLAAITLGLVPVSIVVLLVAPGSIGVIAFVVLFGAARGTSTLTRPALLAHLYGRAQYASIAGVLQFALSVAQAIAPVSVGAAHDALHTYDPIFWCLAALSAVGVLAVLPARARP
ncbi:MAG: MFS transporter, partial [Chloroflexota bacterium]|nr:MFS transporter [Chloroflexota bacterium]